jgi:hypothetical protein
MALPEQPSGGSDFGRIDAGFHGDGFCEFAPNMLLISLFRGERPLKRNKYFPSRFPLPGVGTIEPDAEAPLDLLYCINLVSIAS